MKKILVLFWVLLLIITANAQINTTTGNGAESDGNCILSAASTEQGDMLIRISEIEVYPQYLAEYLTYAITVGETSVREESGVIAIFPMVTRRDSTQIRIVEIYCDQEAYKTHISSTHFQTYKQGTLHMVKSLDLVDMNAMNPTAMSAIFRKMQR